MNIGLVTTCKGRTQHLERTLPQNIKDNPKSSFVVVSYNDTDGLADYMRLNHTTDMECGKVAFYQYRDPVPFRMAHSKNLAHRLGIIEGADVLVNMDADNWAGAGFSDYVDTQFKNRENIFLWSRMIKQGEGRLPRGISGRIAVTKDAFLLSGGYDERFETHSPDDRDFHLRLRKLGYESQEVDPVFLKAILHTDKMRFREYPHVADLPGEDFHTEPAYSIANFGNIGCGVVYKNFSEDPIEIKPVSGRIFGIGMHKTGTTSLHTALQMIGYKSGHWENAHWAKAIWREMNHTGRSPTVENYHALCDLPIPLLFSKLDTAYPGSKFILTLRDEWKWLASCQKHWGPGNKFRSQWDNDPFSHQVHKALYGRIDFDPTTFLRRYREHNAEVLEYFKDRPHDLIVMNMDHGAGWTELCGFLKRRIPDAPYPHVAPGQH